MRWSQRFTEAFHTAYTEAKTLFSPEDWKTIWTTHWNRFMLWNPAPPQSEPVLGITAEKMGLVYWDREPFRVDAAFVRPRPDFRLIGNLLLPLVVAIEHENDFRGFIQEIAKLTHIRCPLITGLVESAEDTNSEYLYLIGVEQSPSILEWHSFHYDVGSGASAGKWSILAV